MQSFRRGYVKATNSPKTSAKDPINSGKILLRVKSVFTWNTLCFSIYGRLLKIHVLCQGVLVVIWLTVLGNFRQQCETMMKKTIIRFSYSSV